MSETTLPWTLATLPPEVRAPNANGLREVWVRDRWEELQKLCRGVVHESRTRGWAPHDLQPSEFDDAVRHLLGEVVLALPTYAPRQDGRFGAWLFERLKWRLVDYWRSSASGFGRGGKHRVVSPPEFRVDGEEWNVDPLDPVDDSPRARLEAASAGGAVDGPESRTDDLLGFLTGRHRGVLRSVPGLGGDPGRQVEESDPETDDLERVA